MQRASSHTMATPIPPSRKAGPGNFIWFDRNALIYMSVLAAGACLAFALGQWVWALVVPLAFLLVTECLYFGLGIEVYSHTNRVRRAYEWFDTYLDGAYGKGRDLTEAYFGDDPHKPFARALEDKFDKFIELLGLRPGDSLLDVGCGYGDFISHAAQRGIHARGLTLSPHQARLCHAQGLDVICADARNMPPELHGQFDAVTYLGCLEHFGSFVTHWDRTRHDALLQSTFANAYRLLKPDSRVRRVLTSTIHQTKMHPRGIDWLHGYLIERHYSGLYPMGDEGLVRNSRQWFDEIYRRDASDDYRLASEVDPLHFGNFRVVWTPRRVAYVPLMALLDPFWMHKWLYHVLGSWMWQFGGVGGLPRPERPVTLWWFVLQAKEAGSIAAPAPAGA
jgi:cyclopropane fatty-acyl-phospholipid synthase-like methyltransferase